MHTQAPRRSATRGALTSHNPSERQRRPSRRGSFAAHFFIGHSQDLIFGVPSTRVSTRFQHARRIRVWSTVRPDNKRMNLTAQVGHAPCWRPSHRTSNGRAQGARPPRSAGYAQRYRDSEQYLRVVEIEMSMVAVSVWKDGFLHPDRATGFRLATRPGSATKRALRSIPVPSPAPSHRATRTTFTLHRIFRCVSTAFA